MKKKTNITSFTAYSIIDMEPPKINLLVNVTRTNCISWEAEDFGTEYDLKVEAFSENKIKNVVAVSDDKHIEVTTGIQGYYYIIDNNTLTKIVGDKNKELYTEEPMYTFNEDESLKYFHVAPIDRSGYLGETMHCLIPEYTPQNLKKIVTYVGIGSGCVVVVGIALIGVFVLKRFIGGNVLDKQMLDPNENDSAPTQKVNNPLYEGKGNDSFNDASNYE